MPSWLASHSALALVNGPSTQPPPLLVFRSRATSSSDHPPPLTATPACRATYFTHGLMRVNLGFSTHVAFPLLSACISRRVPITVPMIFVVRSIFPMSCFLSQGPICWFLIKKRCTLSAIHVRHMSSPLSPYKHLG